MQKKKIGPTLIRRAFHRDTLRKDNGPVRMNNGVTLSGGIEQSKYTKKDCKYSNKKAAFLEAAFSGKEINEQTDYEKEKQAQAYIGLGV